MVLFSRRTFKENAPLELKGSVGISMLRVFIDTLWEQRTRWWVRGRWRGERVSFFRVTSRRPQVSSDHELVVVWREFGGGAGLGRDDVNISVFVLVPSHRVIST